MMSKTYMLSKVLTGAILLGSSQLSAFGLPDVSVGKEMSATNPADIQKVATLIASIGAHATEIPALYEKGENPDILHLVAAVEEEMPMLVEVLKLISDSSNHKMIDQTSDICMLAMSEFRENYELNNKEKALRALDRWFDGWRDLSGLAPSA